MDYKFYMGYYILLVISNNPKIPQIYKNINLVIVILLAVQIAATIVSTSNNQESRNIAVALEYDR